MEREIYIIYVRLARSLYLTRSLRSLVRYISLALLEEHRASPSRARSWELASPIPTPSRSVYLGEHTHMAYEVLPNDWFLKKAFAPLPPNAAKSIGIRGHTLKSYSIWVRSGTRFYSMVQSEICLQLIIFCAAKFC